MKSSIASTCRRAAGALVLSALAVACSADFEPSYRVSGLRVLAVRADQPYAAPGETVHLTTLAFDTQSRPLTWGWGTCVDPTSSEVVDCVDSVDWSSFTIAAGADTHDVAIPADAISRLPVDVQARATVGVLVVTCPGALSVAPSPPGVAATGALPFTCKDAASGRVLAADEYQVGVKRIFVRATDRNANPVLSGIAWDGKAWADGADQPVQACDVNGNDLGDCASSLVHQVGASAAAGSAETGVDSFGQAYTEQVIVDYYATEGILDDGVRTAASPVTKWAARRQSAGSTVTMWMVLRDDRGGVDWATRTVDVGAVAHE